MSRKEIDWSFYIKMIIAVIFIFFMLTLILFGNKAFNVAEDDTSKKSEKKTEFKRPIRMQIMVLNTITLFFILMSIQEYRLNEFMSPQGVDPEKIPSKCKTQQQGYYWVGLLICIGIVFYNYTIQFNIFRKPSYDNIVLEQSGGSKTSMVTYISRIKLKNGGVIVEKYPYFAEFCMAVLFAIFAAIMYIMLVLINYNIVKSSIFESCFSPLNNDRFYDPFAEEKPVEKTSV